MNCKVFIGGNFKFGTLINNVENEYDAESFALKDFYDRHPDIEVDSLSFTVERLEDGDEEEKET